MCEVHCLLGCVVDHVLAQLVLTGTALLLASAAQAHLPPHHSYMGLQEGA